MTTENQNPTAVDQALALLTEHRHCPKCPVLVPDVQVARQFKRHLIQFPGETSPRWYISIAQAMAVAAALDYERIVLCCDERHMTLHLPKETP